MLQVERKFPAARNVAVVCTEPVQVRVVPVVIIPMTAAEIATPVARWVPHIVPAVTIAVAHLAYLHAVRLVKQAFR